MKRPALVLVAIVIGCPGRSAAQPFPERDLPSALQPWTVWVRDQIPDRVCPAVHGSAVCLWPGRLDLRLTAAGGTFGLEAHADRTLDLRLPGDAEHWPQDVRVDGRPAPVIERDGGPTLRLDAGRHRVEGRFAWTHLPDALPVPARLALVDLVVDGRPVPLPRRDEAGLWLRPEGESTARAESLQLQAFRRIVDGIPQWAETRVSLEVSGKAREVELRGALLPGSVTAAVSGGLPARVDESGRLHVQVRAGSFAVTVLSRLEGRPSEITRGPFAEPWPAREVWVFAADERLRQVELAGLQPIDPSRTDLPGEWRQLPAFIADAGSRLTLKEVRRGETAAPPDKIQLRRELWLDTSGGGFTVRDRFSGALSQTWRLDLDRPAELGRVSVDAVEQLITANPATKAPGVELRRSVLRVEADSRLPRGRLGAVGWSADVEQLGATVHLPPGWSLFTTTGVDGAPDAWTSRWTLLGFFFVLIVALATGRLFGRGWGVVALAAMVFTHDEPDAPFLVWLSLLGATALLAVAPAGWLHRIARIWRAASLVVLALILLPFLRDQVRTALFPQVAMGEGPWSHLVEAPKRAPGPVAGFAPPATMMPAAPSPQPQAGEAESGDDALGVEGGVSGGVEGGVPGGVVGGVVGGLPDAPEETKKRFLQSAGRLSDAAPSKSNAFLLNPALEQDPRAVVQTGPGVPAWTWKSYALRWTGPVKKDQRFRLWLASPGLNRLATFVRLALLLVLALRLLVGGAPVGSARAPHGAAAAIALALVAFWPRPASAQAPIPDPELREELKERLNRPQPCQPNCVSTSILHLRLRGDAVVFEAEVHAADAGAWAVPGPPTSWAPTQVRIDGQATGALARLDDGFLYVRVPAGVHRVEAAGPVPPADTITLQLRDRPHRADADTPGWDVAGLRADGPPDASVQMSRRLRAGERAREESGSYAPWLQVTRTLSLGLTWRLRTEVRRVSPPGAPISLRVPLIAGEAPTTADLQTEDGVALVALGRDQMDADWASTLPVPKSLDLTLRAPEGQPWSEVWRLECGVIWACEAQGLPPIAVQRQGVLAPEYRPWPGESLALRFQHPQAVPGQTITIQRVRLETTPGERLTTTSMTLDVRASREEPLLLTLPADAEVQEVTVGGAARPSRPDQGRLRITLPAGAQAVAVRWREPRGMSLYRRVPVVGLPLPAVNVETVLHLPENRWLLFTRGPSWGPAVLFWGYLVFALLVALALGLFADTPLGMAQWLLLILGLTQTGALGGLLVIGLFLALAWRSRRPPLSALAHDLVQILLVVWVVVALAVLYSVIEQGLLLRPDMQVAGAESTNAALRWYADRVQDATPPAGAVTVPLWIYRGLMLAWALWLAAALVRWAGWMWRALAEGGFWRPLPRRRKKAKAVEPAPTTTPEEPTGAG